MSTPKDILESGYTKLAQEYERRDIEPGTVVEFGLKPTWNVVIGTHGCCGVAISFRGNYAIYADDQTRLDIDELKPYVGASLFDVAQDYVRSKIISERSIALAALNALSQPIILERTEEQTNNPAANDLHHLIQQDDVVAIIGYGGLVKHYLGRGRELHVTDMRPAASLTTVVVGDVVECAPKEVILHSADDDQAVLSRADVAVITASTIVNATFAEVVGYADNARIRCIYGPSAQLLPDVFFDSGIDAVMSVAICNPAQLERDMINELDIEPGLRRHQRKYFVVAPRLAAL
jgi:uncharacterized protein (DUF4213/DUF364 family)